MASAKLKSQGMAAGLAVLTASGIIGIAVVALGVTLPACGPQDEDQTGCAPEQQQIAASVAIVGSEEEPAGPVTPAAAPAEVQASPSSPAERVVPEMPRREGTAVETAAAAVMADQIKTASISVRPARAATEAKPVPLREETVALAPAAGDSLQGPAAPDSTASVVRKAVATPASAPKATPLPVPEPLAPMVAPEVPEKPVATGAPELQTSAAEAAVATELSVVPPAAVTIAGDAVNVRATPSTSGERLYVFREGTEVTPAGQSQGWAKIADAEGRSGWVDAKLLANVDLAALPELDPAPQTAAEPAPAAEVRTVTGSGVNVRSGPSGSSGKLFALAGGTKVEVTGEDGGWLNIVDPEGRSGWAYSDYFN